MKNYYSWFPSIINRRQKVLRTILKFKKEKYVKEN